MAPWSIVKSIQKLALAGDDDPNNEAQRKDELARQQALLAGTIFVSAESIRILGILLQPFMPGKAAEMLDLLGVAPERRTFAYARMAADFSYGTPLMDISREGYAGLFPQLDVED